jgi:hypothetical protein
MRWASSITLDVDSRSDETECVRWDNLGFVRSVLYMSLRSATAFEG